MCTCIKTQLPFHKQEPLCMEVFSIFINTFRICEIHVNKLLIFTCFVVFYATNQNIIISLWPKIDQIVVKWGKKLTDKLFFTDRDIQSLLGLKVRSVWLGNNDILYCVIIITIII